MKLLVLVVSFALISSCSTFSENPDSRTTASEKGKPAKPAKPTSKYDNTAQKFIEEPPLIICHDSNGSGLNDFRMKYVPTPIITAATPAASQASAAASAKKPQDGQLKIFANGGEYTYSAQPDKNPKKKEYVVTMSADGFDKFITAISTEASVKYTNVKPTEVRFSATPIDSYPAQFSLKLQDLANPKIQTNLNFGCGTE
jgi:hypothetical protein